MSSRTKSEDLALLVLSMAKAVREDLNVSPDSRLAADCKEARELAVQVLGDHVVQALSTYGCTIKACYRCDFAPGTVAHDGEIWCEPCHRDHTKGSDCDGWGT